MDKNQIISSEDDVEEIGEKEKEKKGRERWQNVYRKENK